MEWIEFAALLILAGIIWYAGKIPEDGEEWND